MAGSRGHANLLHARQNTLGIVANHRQLGKGGALTGSLDR